MGTFLLGRRSDRRTSGRFPIERDLRYKILNADPAASGTGRTINISSTGVLFTAQAPLPPGGQVQVLISWPARIDGKCRLRLKAEGRVVRCNGRQIAMAIEKYEFRTAASPARASRTAS